MSVSLDPAVDDQLEEGELVILPLVRIDLPGKTVGYHIGGRPLPYGGLTYLPNRYLQAASFDNALGNEITARDLVFSNVPVDNPEDAFAAIEDYDYLNASVTTSWLAGKPGTNEVLGALYTEFHEIDQVRFEGSGLDENGERTVTLIVTLEPPARRFSDQSYARASQDEQQFDNDADDDFFKFNNANAEWPEQWGQRTA